jgi:hypothetical protein
VDSENRCSRRHLLGISKPRSSFKVGAGANPLLSQLDQLPLDLRPNRINVVLEVQQNFWFALLECDVAGISALCKRCNAIGVRSSPLEAQKPPGLDSGRLLVQAPDLGSGVVGPNLN